METIYIKYYSVRAYLTLDVYRLFAILFETFGESKILIEPMSEEEKAEASEYVDGIEAIKNRFIILKKVYSEDLVRCEEVEERAVLEGSK